MKLDFTDRTVIVTGGSCGIGAGISIEFAAAGANVIIDYLPIESDIKGLKQVEAVMKKNGWSYKSFAGDITSAVEMEELCSLAVSNFGSVDILVNSAGFTEPTTTMELSLDLWKKGIEVNLTGAFVVTKAVLKYMVPLGKGRIVYIGSAGSITGGGGAAFYSAAKAGINGLVRSMSKELAPKGITVNAILPALIETNLLMHRVPDPVKRKELIQRIPVGRFGQPEDVAYLTLFLASDYAEFISGQQIIIDGGSTFK
jgi:3-oxoacyl-[acyl-carrier protein] reductase